MNKVMRVGMVAVLLAMVSGCASSGYSTVKTGPDRFSVSGSDPNRVKGEAFKACKDEGFDDYTVLDSTKAGMTVRCEKNEPGITEKVSKAWGEVKETVSKKIDEYRK